MKTILAILVLSIALVGCKDDRKKSGGSKPAPSETQKVPDAPSGLQLSAIAAASVAAYWVTTRKEKIA